MELTIIKGDGIGPEIMDVTLEVLKAVGADFTYDFVAAGEGALNTHGDTLPAETLASIERTGLALKGPLSTPSGGGYTSVNVRLRKHFDLYANVRPPRRWFLAAVSRAWTSSCSARTWKASTAATSAGKR